MTDAQQFTNAFQHRNTGLRWALPLIVLAITAFAGPAEAGRFSTLLKGLKGAKAARAEARVARRLLGSRSALKTESALARTSTKHARLIARLSRWYGKSAIRQWLARHGKAFVRFAKKYGRKGVSLFSRVGSKARRLLLADSKRAMGLARRYGTPALQLEAKAPGMGAKAASLFQPKELALAAKAPARDVPMLVGLAERATSPQARSLLLHTYEAAHGAQGARFLAEAAKVSRTTGMLTPKAILAVGGAVGITLVAGGAAYAAVQIGKGSRERVKADIIAAKGDPKGYNKAHAGKKNLLQRLSDSVAGGLESTTDTMSFAANLVILVLAMIPFLVLLPWILRQIGRARSVISENREMRARRERNLEQGERAHGHHR